MEKAFVKIPKFKRLFFQTAGIIDLESKKYEKICCNPSTLRNQALSQTFSCELSENFQGSIFTKSL